MVFEPDTYSESSTIMENIIVEARCEFILQNRGKTAGQTSVVGAPCPYCEQRFGAHMALFHYEIQQFCHFGANLAQNNVISQ